MAGPLKYRAVRPITGMLYVCETGGPEIARILAGPYDYHSEATAAAGAIEAEHPEYSARTEIWRYPEPESDARVIVLPIAAGSFLSVAKI
jgi:hypothetical protein